MLENIKSEVVVCSVGGRFVVGRLNREQSNDLIVLEEAIVFNLIGTPQGPAIMPFDVTMSPTISPRTIKLNPNAIEYIVDTDLDTVKLIDTYRTLVTGITMPTQEETKKIVFKEGPQNG